jgi:hypothetical protein
MRFSTFEFSMSRTAFCSHAIEFAKTQTPAEWLALCLSLMEARRASSSSHQGQDCKVLAQGIALFEGLYANTPKRG